MDPFDKLPFEGLLSRASTLVERSGPSGLVEWQGRRDRGRVPCPSEALAEEGMSGQYVYAELLLCPPKPRQRWGRYRALGRGEETS
jgi:hypothetical protein